MKNPLNILGSLGLVLVMAGIPVMAQIPERPPATDDDLKREERDAQYMMRLQVQNAEAQAKTQSKLREEQERAASAMRQIYDGILERQRVETGALTEDERNVLALRGAGMGQPNAGMVQPNVANGLPVGGMIVDTPQSLPGTHLRSGAESSRAIDALALEDGPEIARQKGLGFVPIGTIADVRLLTAVNTAIPGIVIAQLVYDIWDVDARMVVIPRGSKLIGQAGAMSSDTEARGKIVFTQFVDPGGRVIPIATPVLASNRIGIAGVDGTVDYHWMRMMGSSLALAVVAGFTGGNSASPASTGANNNDLVRQNMVTSMGQTSNQLLQRFAKVQPDITIEEGAVAKIILSTSLMAKPYRVVWGN